VKLTDSEKEFLEGNRGKAQQKAMELLVRYAEALGAERFVDTNNVCGVPGSANPFLQNYYKDKGTSEYDAIFSFFDLDSDELVEAPQALVSTCCLQGGADPDNWETLGTKPQVFSIYKDREQFAADHGVKILKTCTPYIVGNTPARGEHCAWMESSAVVYCNGPTPRDARARAPRCSRERSPTGDFIAPSSGTGRIESTSTFRSSR